MKKRIASIILAVVMVVGLLPMTSFAANAVAIDTSNFPDDEFREYIQYFDLNSDGVLSNDERSAVKSIDPFEFSEMYPVITTLKGIEYFENLESLSCGQAQISGLDVSKNTKLKALHCSFCKLTSLDVSKNPLLTELNCRANQLSNLDVSNNPLLAELDCGWNQLCDLDVSNNPCLTKLSCDGNQIGNLAFAGNPLLTELDCSIMQLSALDVTGNTELKTLRVGSNQLKALDISNNAELTTLDCSDNELTELNITKNTKLKELHCEENRLISLDITNGPNLTVIHKDDSVKFVIVEEEPPISIEINSSNFPDPVFRSYVADTIDKNGDGVLYDVELAMTQSISVSGKGITSLEGIEYFSNIESLDCSHNNLEALDISHNRGIKSLCCTDNRLTELDVSKNDQLFRLECAENDLSDLDVTTNCTLGVLVCGNNALASIDISKNVMLLDLQCEYNQLTSLDVSNNRLLNTLYCDNNFLHELDVSKNTQLFRLSCCSNPIRILDISNCIFLSENNVDSGIDPTVIDNPVDCPSSIFTDVPGKDNWAHEGIDFCVANDYMNGVSDTTFAPKGTVTRAQLVTILYRVAGSPEAVSNNSFTDVPSGMWYSDAVAWAEENGIVNGVSPGMFVPMGVITREQIATILYRYSNEPNSYEYISSFPDAAKVHPYAVDALNWAIGAGIINGIDVNGTSILAPQNNATREQIASIILRFLGCMYYCS